MYYFLKLEVSTISLGKKVPGDEDGLFHKDLLFFSVENFVGGMQTCGVLVVKQALLKACKRDGGKSLLSSNAIGEPLRGGLAMQLKMKVGPRFILERQQCLIDKTLHKLQGLSSLILLGGPQRHLATFSFVVKHQASGLYLHHNFVCALLNDLFGIQARSHCALDSRHARSLFNLRDGDYNVEVTNVIGTFTSKHELNVIKPGYVTMDLPWFADEAEVRTFSLFKLRI